MNFTINLSHRNCILFVLMLSLLYLNNSGNIFAQNGYRFRVSLIDKAGVPYSIDRPEEFLSIDAINRRINAGISIDEQDLPVSQVYIDSLKNMGFTVSNPSKWMNAVIVATDDSLEIDEIKALNFVKSVTLIAIYSGEKSAYTKFIDDKTKINSTIPIIDSTFYGVSYGQIKLENGQKLHEMGYFGQGMKIAIIDAGFYHANTLPLLKHLFDENRILGWRDFVNPASDIFLEHAHGMKVLSITGGFEENKFVGTAPKASFWLLRSEDVNSEQWIEEDNWVCAAEFADSAGVDIINTSLGYSDDFNFDYMKLKYSDMNGDKTYITKAADIAASKGMLVVVSAGNEGESSWHYISAPADGDSVLTVGAVNVLGEAAHFSSYGPTYDNRVKPDISAVGWGTFHQDIDGTIISGNGTSFSAPVITGLAACLWQAHPEATSTEIIQAIQMSADLYYAPDDHLGYGIPDFHVADQFLTQKKSIEDKILVQLLNSEPFSVPELTIVSEEPLDNIKFELFDHSGSRLESNIFEVKGWGAQIPLNFVANYKNRIVFLRITINDFQKTIKIVR